MSGTFARISTFSVTALFAAAGLVSMALLPSEARADQKKLSDDQRVEILRGLTAEYAKCVVPLPRSKKPLDVQSDGNWDKQQWADAAKQNGPAGRVGDMVQVTKVIINDDHIILEINNGVWAKGAWKDHVSIGMNGAMNPISQGQTAAPSGTYIALQFGQKIGELSSSDIKKMLAPVLLFDNRTVTQQYVDTIPTEYKKAIEEKKPVEGMDRDQVLLALGRPVSKSRETKDGVEYEDWVYGTPPGKVIFVTFVGPKVVKVKETYAGLGGSIAETPKEP